MSFSNPANVAFSARYPIDKIVGVWEGSFNRATDVVTRTGSFGDIYVYRIAHGFTRPVFTDLLWSLDGITYLDGGIAATGGEVSISFADSTYIYIVSSVFAPAVGTMRYKVIGFWIDNYDATNPVVERYSAPQKAVSFDSRSNYQKIYDQNVLSFGSASTQTVTHSLGNYPNFRVFFEAFSGEVWPMNFGGATNPFNYDAAQTECLANMSANSLAIELTGVPSTRRAWYRIYLDA